MGGCGGCQSCGPSEKTRAAHPATSLRPLTPYEEMKIFLEKGDRLWGESAEELATVAISSGWTVAKLEALESKIKARLSRMPAGNFPVVYRALREGLSLSPINAGILKPPVTYAKYAGIAINLSVSPDNVFLQPRYFPHVFEHETHHLSQIKHYVDNAGRYSRELLFTGTQGGYKFEVGNFQGVRLNFLVVNGRQIDNSFDPEKIRSIIALYRSRVFRGDADKAMDLVVGKLMEVAAWAKANEGEKVFFNDFMDVISPLISQMRTPELKIFETALHQAIADGHGITIENADFKRAREQAEAADPLLYQNVYEIFAIQFAVAQSYLPV